MIDEKQTEIPERAELLQILQRAGVPEDFREKVLDAVLDEEPFRLGHDPRLARILHAAASSLLRDAMREGRRWTARVKLVERRTEFALEALRGGHDDRLG